MSPEVPHFARVIGEQDGAAEHSHAALPTMQAPVICQLCGAGFLSWKDLWKHATRKHHSWSEARKRLIFEVQQRASVPLRPIEKRRLAANFMQDMLYSCPGRNTVQPGKVVIRQIVAYAICAIKDWIDDFYPCYMWKDAPDSATIGASEHNIEDNTDPDTDDEDETTHRRTNGPQLRDDQGFCYLGPPEKIHPLLDVELYVPVVPKAPLEELHASSVQHPRFPAMRWLLHTKRVPVLESTECTSEVTNNVRPSCAGTGDTEKPAWICHNCAYHLCSSQPRMPPQALANWNW